MIVIGQHFFSTTGLHNECVVIDINGEQTINTTGDSNAQFTLVDTLTGDTFRLPEFIINGRKWLLRDTISTPDQIEILKTKAEATKKAKIAAKEKAAQAFNRKQESLKANKEFKHLTPIVDKYSYKETAKNIRAELKEKFGKDIKFSVRCDGSAIRIRYSDDTLNFSTVMDSVRKFQHGNFDGMTDSYEYNVTAFNSVFGGCQYVFVFNDGFKLS